VQKQQTRVSCTYEHDRPEEQASSSSPFEIGSESLDDRAKEGPSTQQRSNDGLSVAAQVVSTVPIRFTKPFDEVWHGETTTDDSDIISEAAQESVPKISLVLKQLRRLRGILTEHLRELQRRRILRLEVI
jgi:hypothetical protein